MKKPVNILALLILPLTLMIFIISCQEEEDNDHQPDIIPVMVFSDRGGVWGLDEKGVKQLITNRIVDHYRLIVGVEVLGDLLYVHNNYVVSVYDLSGNLIKDIEISREVSYPLTFCILPDSSFAFLDNKNDKVSFTSASGEFIEEIDMGDKTVETLQNVHGLVIDSCLIVANIGDSLVMKINFFNYENSILPIKADGDLDYFNNTFYWCSGQTVHKAVPDLVEYEILCNLPAYNAAGIAIDKNGQFAYVTTNFGNKIFKVDLINGSCAAFISGLDYPEDIEWIK